MDSNAIITALSALAQTTRLEVFRRLMAAEPHGIAAGDLARALDVPQNTLSSHLATLARAGLVRATRSGRSIAYRAELSQIREVVVALIDDCCDRRPEICAPLAADLSPLSTKRLDPMSDRPFSVLFLCTGNSARSILAESILAKDGAGRFQAHSAGSQPRGEVHPMALQVLDSFGYPTEGFRSKSWEEFAAKGAPGLDFVFTVCDNAAGEACPVWPGQPITAHWGIEDPAAVVGTAIERERAFVQAFKYLRHRISIFAALPIGALDALALVREVEAIGRLDGATTTPVA